MFIIYKVNIKIYIFPGTQLLNIPSDIYLAKQMKPLNFTEVI